MNNLLKEYYTARESHDKALKKLDAEVTRIVGVITKFFKRTNFWWAYDYYEGSDNTNPLPQRVHGGDFPIYISEYCESDKVSYSGGFPIQFFDWTNAQINAYLTAEALADREKSIAKEQKELAAKIAKQTKVKALKQAALSKLSPEERKVLKL